jgi:hypothetical protein
VRRQQLVPGGQLDVVSAHGAGAVGAQPWDDAPVGWGAGGGSRGGG